MESMTRNQLIDRLRAELVRLTDDDRCSCMVAAEKGIFCRGFARLSSTELRDRFRWLEEKAHRRLTTHELRERANTWQLARQQVHNVDLACDVETEDRDQCMGWNEFTDDQLRGFHRELLGTDVAIQA